MKRVFVVVGLVAMLILSAGCLETNQQTKDSKVVNKQNAHYAKVQPIPFYDYSIPRDVLTQIYNVVTQEARNTYTVIASITGEVQFFGPSVGYGIPADVQLTNPQMRTGGGTVAQAEPNGLFSSNNTDGTWVLFVNPDGTISPTYTEQKVTTYPYVVTQNRNGVWVRADNQPASFTVDLNEKKSK